MSDNEGIHVDDDWKRRAEAEKLAAEKQQHDQHDEDEQMPEASFMMLVSTLATQAIAALGQLEDPATGKVTVFKPLAKHMIDLLGILETKTAGNLDEDEAEQLKQILAQLRMLYVQTPDGPTQMREGIDGGQGDSDGPSIVLP